MTDLRTLANPFQFTDLDIRTAVDQDDQVWFCAKDVCQALEIEWKGTETLENIPEDWFMVRSFRTIKGERDTLFINEPGLYRLIFRSNKPKAVEFSNWVCSEVLPTIRKNGFFGEVSSRDRLAYSKQIVEITSRLTSTKDAMLFKMLVDELRDCCNVVGRPMPDLTLLGKDYKQLDLLGKE
ncbi:Bro-N domain-containing protein [Methylophaga sp. OBS4]|uniref:BRO-N domain-containing protein n=1 Tax=Methylophaga sp. OBS4 TaxID=2991935 RepID=UPI00225B3784|nr:BRO family protein [Methylophaga sp. OBS4]MCX4187147.1 BRO family protein [Methylophaga sp. OBS4]